MLFGKRDSSTSAKYFPGIDPDHPAIVASAYVALLLFAVLLHRGALNGGWMEADASELLSVINNPFRRLLFDRDAWKTFADNAFTPVLAGLYRGDMLLFAGSVNMYLASILL